MAYLYQADLYYNDCGRAIADRLYLAGQRSDDSDTMPQYVPNGGGEADSPQHCGSGAGCKDAIVLRQKSPITGKRTTYRIGAWLENDLTEAGRAYVREAVRDRQGLCRRLYPRVEGS